MLLPVCSFFLRCRGEPTVKDDTLPPRGPRSVSEDRAGGSTDV